MSRKYFGTDGIRGRVGTFPITPEFILKLGWAAGRVLAAQGRGRVIIGKDTRISGYMFESSLEAGFSAAGVDVQLLGPMPTPGIAYLTRTLHASAGVVVSASHNAHHDNGIKFFSAKGTKLPDEIEQAIEDELDKPMTTAESANLGKAVRLEDAAGRYIEFCKRSIPITLDFSSLKIVIDCANGATYHIAPSVFSELGATVITESVKPDGLNINVDSGSTKPSILQKAVVKHKADLGIAFDGDGDRVVMVDHKGNIVDGDDIIYIIASSRKAEDRLTGPVVGTLMSNLGFEHALKRIGIDLVRANVGDRYVMEMLKQYGSNIGGENSGHIICMDCTTTGDGIITALQVLASMVMQGKKLSEMLTDLKKYPQHMINVTIDKKIDINKNSIIMDAVHSMEKHLQDRGRILLRPSGTEPLIRVMVEGEDDNEVRSCAEELAKIVEKQCV